MEKKYTFLAQVQYRFSTIDFATQILSSRVVGSEKDFK